MESQNTDDHSKGKSKTLSRNAQKRLLPPRPFAVFGRNVVPRLAPSRSAKRTPRKVQKEPRAIKRRGRKQKKRFKLKNSREFNPVKHTQRNARSFREAAKKTVQKQKNKLHIKAVFMPLHFLQLLAAMLPPRPFKARQENHKKRP